MSALPVKWKVPTSWCKIQKLGSEWKNNWPNHKINGNSESPKSLIQADNGQTSMLVNSVRSIRSSLLSGNYTETRLTFFPSKGVYVFLKEKQAERTEKLYKASHAVLSSSIEVYTHSSMLPIACSPSRLCRWWGCTISKVALLRFWRIFILLPLVRLLSLLPVSLLFHLHLARSVLSSLIPRHVRRYQVNKDRIVSIIVCRCYHEDVVITTQTSFIHLEGEITNVVHVIFIITVWNIFLSRRRECPHSITESIQQSPLPWVFFASFSV